MSDPTQAAAARLMDALQRTGWVEGWRRNRFGRWAVTARVRRLDRARGFRDLSSRACPTLADALNDLASKVEARRGKAER